MRKIIYFILAGLTIAGLASCDKQEIKPTSEKDVYSIVIEEELQTKVDADMVVGDKKTFHAYLKKNGTPINCSDWKWSPGNLFRNDESGKCTYQGVTAAYMNATAIATGTAKVTAMANVSGVGDISGDRSMSVKTISSLTFTVASTEIMAGGSTTYTVKATYSDGSTADVTSEATISSTNSVGLNFSGGIISTSKINGCLGKRSLTASYGGKTSSSVDFTVTTDFDYLKFNFNSESDVFSDIRDYAINTKVTQYGISLHPENDNIRSGEITFSVRSFYLFIKGSTDPFYGNYSFKMDNNDFRDTIRMTAKCGESYTLHILYLGEEVFSQRIAIVTN